MADAPLLWRSGICLSCLPLHPPLPFLHLGVAGGEGNEERKDGGKGREKENEAVSLLRHCQQHAHHPLFRTPRDPGIEHKGDTMSPYSTHTKTHTPTRTCAHYLSCGSWTIAGLLAVRVVQAKSEKSMDLKPKSF